MSSPSDPSCTFVIPAAGAGIRFGAPVPKQYVEIDGAPIIIHTLRRCLSLPRVERAIVAVALDQRDSFSDLIRRFDLRDVHTVVGGATRQESVLSALQHLDTQPHSVVAIHDAVRPFFSRDLFAQLYAAAIEHGASVPLLPLSDTLHRHDKGAVVETPDRSNWGLAQTPQCFRFEIIFSAMKRAQEENVTGTDDAGIAAHFGATVRAVRGENGNFKITHPNDLERAAAILRSRGELE